MAASEDAREIAEMIVEDAARALTVEDAPKGPGILAEIPKSPRTPSSKKYK